MRFLSALPIPFLPASQGEKQRRKTKVKVKTKTKTKTKASEHAVQSAPMRYLQ
jgi:hypothetical protein